MKNWIISIIIAYGLPAFLAGGMTALALRDVVLPLMVQRVEIKKATQEQKKPLTLQEVHEFVRKNRVPTNP